MSTPTPGTDQQRQVWATVCEVAGTLAERGIREVTLIAGRSRRILMTRQTDLPTELYNSPVGSHLLSSGGEWVRDQTNWRPARADEAAYG